MTLQMTQQVDSTGRLNLLLAHLRNEILAVRIGGTATSNQAPTLIVLALNIKFDHVKTQRDCH
jgi:hypothetical protein